MSRAGRAGRTRPPTRRRTGTGAAGAQSATTPHPQATLSRDGCTNIAPHTIAEQEQQTAEAARSAPPARVRCCHYETGRTGKHSAYRYCYGSPNHDGDHQFGSWTLTPPCFGCDAPSTRMDDGLPLCAACEAPADETPAPPELTDAPGRAAVALSQRQRQADQPPAPTRTDLERAALQATDETDGRTRKERAADRLAAMLALIAATDPGTPLTRALQATESSNENRVLWAEAALHTFAVVTGLDLETDGYDTAISDLLSDLMHLADARTLDWAEIVTRAAAHYEYETSGPGGTDPDAEPDAADRRLCQTPGQDASCTDCGAQPYEPCCQTDNHRPCPRQPAASYADAASRVLDRIAADLAAGHRPSPGALMPSTPQRFADLLEDAATLIRSYANATPLDTTGYTADDARRYADQLTHSARELDSPSNRRQDLALALFADISGSGGA